MDERIFVGVFPTGISYADRRVEIHGDYKKLAFLSFATLELEFYRGCPGKFIPQIAGHAVKFQEKEGEQFEISSSGQTVTLGYALK